MRSIDDPIILINPPAANVIEEYDAPRYGHLGLAYLASALRQAGIASAILDAKLARMGYDDVLKAVLGSKARVVGISSHTHEIKTASDIAAYIKKRAPSIKTVIGGIHASSLPKDTLESFGSFDYLVKGEGEFSFVRLAEAILSGRGNEVSSIPGVGYLKDGHAEMTPPLGWTKELDKITFPAWDLFPPLGIFPVISSRGCPYQCIFCARMLGEQVRVRSAENVIAELKMIDERFGARNIYFYDETFGFYRDWLEKFLALMVSSGLNRRLKWGITTRAHLIEEKILRSFKEAGCTKIDFGVESGDERILKVIRKGERLEDFVRASRLIKNAGIESHGYFILGHPNETKETAANTINFAAKLNTDHISIGIMIPYPGTEVSRLAMNGQGGYKKLSVDWSDYNKQLGNALELESVSRAELTRLQLLGYLKFYVRNFKIAAFLSALFKYRRLILAIVVKYFKSFSGEKAEKR